MSTPPAAPALPKEDDKTQWCLNTTAVRGKSLNGGSFNTPEAHSPDFLRLSRATSDDSISAHLNSLLTPSRSNPFTSSTPTQSLPPRGNRRNIPDETCDAFKHRVLFPGWSTRDAVLTSCSSVATKLQSSSVSDTPPASGSRNYWGASQTVNERLDPYSARDYEWTRSSQAQQLQDVLRNEARTEKIVRSRSWAVLGERCMSGVTAGQTADDHWQNEYRAWASRNAS